MFVPTERNTVDGHSENNLHIQRITRGIGGIDVQEAEARAPPQLLIL